MAHTADQAAPFATGAYPTRHHPGSFDVLSDDAYLSLGAMEGMYPAIVETIRPTEAPKPRETVWPGYVLAMTTAAAAYIIGHIMLPDVGAAIIAIVAGAAVRNLLPVPATTGAGCRRIVRKGIPVAIILMGAGLNLTLFRSIGLPALFITVGGIVVSMVGAYYCGRALGLEPRTALLIGAGTGICGNSAIVAVAPLIDAEDDDLVLSMGTVNLFGMLVVLVWPLIGTVLALNDGQYGVWCGTTIHAVPQVAAAGFARGADSDAGAIATAVKLVRVTLLAPMMVVLAMMYARRHVADGASGSRVIIHYARLVPGFVWGFVALALLNTLGLLPSIQFDIGEPWRDAARSFSFSMAGLFKESGKVLLTLAMAAIGLEVNIRLLGRVGGRAVLTGFIVTVLLAVFSLVLVRLFV
ncbi:MAG: putative sulfate exporter family transporter [Phycisphaerales bacterium]|nr:putative sulfate exporter family transporter [Phycisphaerales bacterium]